MAQIYNGSYSVAFDLSGCPQTCRHCWIGGKAHKAMDGDQVFASFARIKAEQERGGWYDARVEYLGLEYREPHFHPEYQKLYARMDEVNACIYEVDRGFDLVSQWRLTRDPAYIPWLKARGIRRAQLKVFGMAETNAFFYGRKDAQEDLVQGSLRLLDQGIIPRWQIYYNKKGLGELTHVLQLARDLDMERRCQDAGGEFAIHGFTFDPDGFGWDNRDLGLDDGDQNRIPPELLERSAAWLGETHLFKSEAQWCQELESCTEPVGMPPNHWLWFFVDEAWDVYPNLMGPAPWWRLGNLATQGWGEILDAWVHDRCRGLLVCRDVPVGELVRRHGDFRGRKLYTSRNEFLTCLLNAWFRSKA